MKRFFNIYTDRLWPFSCFCQVWDPQSWTSERTLSDHTGTVRCFAACADRLLSGSDDGSIKVSESDADRVCRR